VIEARVGTATASVARVGTATRSVRRAKSASLRRW
jgi:hypothetical protein